LQVGEENMPPSVSLADNNILLSVRPRSTIAKRHQIMQRFYREELRAASAPLIEKWEKVIRVKVTKLYLRSMKSRWGSCNYNKATIRLNTELAKRPPGSLEYVVVHEMVHLLEPSHNKRFKALISQYLPAWKQFKAELNHPGEKNNT
jgi:predicted metal-dependent hydrolase